RASRHPIKEQPRPLPGLPEKTSDQASTASLRPDHALIAAERHLAHALEVEFLHALTLEGLGRIDVALGIDRDAVHAVELARLAAAAAERGQLRHGVALDDAHALVLAVGEIDEALPGILREGDLPGRARGQRVLGE